MRQWLILSRYDRRRNRERRAERWRSHFPRTDASRPRLLRKEHCFDQQLTNPADLGDETVHRLLAESLSQSRPGPHRIFERSRRGKVPACRRSKGDRARRQCLSTLWRLSAMVSRKAWDSARLDCYPKVDLKYGGPGARRVLADRIGFLRYHPTASKVPRPGQ